MPGLDVPIDSADARERRETDPPVRPYPPRARRSHRGQDADEVLAELRAKVDGHPLGRRARRAAVDLVWPYSKEPPGLAKSIEVEQEALDLLADAEWVASHQVAS